MSTTHACVGGPPEAPAMMCDVDGGEFADIEGVNCPGCIEVLYECLTREDCAKIGMGKGRERWRPSNGTLGSAFVNDWCGSCAKNDGCGIRLKTRQLQVWQPGYPMEWVRSDEGVECTAWEE